MKCRICSSETRELFRARLLSKHDVGYYLCPHCGFLQTETPYWLEEAYAIPINDSDTGLMQRNLILSRVTATLILSLFDRCGVFLDFAGGYGVFVRLMRDMGFDFLWQDRYANNLVARGFDFASYRGPNRVELITSMETFEHFENPMEDIKRMLAVSNNILFSTMLLPNPPPAPNNWWYYGLEHGQHISLYQYKTFKWIADSLGLHFCSNHRNLHLFSTKKVSEVVFRVLVPTGAILGGVASRLMLKSKTESDMLLAAGKRHDQAKSAESALQTSPKP